MPNTSPIAVVAMACRFPQAADLTAYWKNITAKVDTTRKVTPLRWIVPPDDIVQGQPAPDRPFSDRSCLIDPFDFDPTGFLIDPAVLADLDPLYHLILDTAKALLRTSESPSVAKDKTGVILAALALPTDASSTLTRKLFSAVYEKHLFGTATYQPPDLSQAMAARVVSLPAALLAAAMGLKGGSFTLDAACASSLYAIKLACDELSTGRADAMLAGGVSRPECLYTQVGFSQLRALSPSGRCAPFDETADGLVVGEGAGLVVLKRLEDALAQGDRVHAVIRGSGVSNDMRGNLLAPDSEGQLRAMQMAYAAAGWSPDSVGLIECHGAGTPRGDHTELASLCRLWDGYAGPTGDCAIGSVKSMIGHTLTAAGAAGFIKTVLALEQKCLPPSLHFHRPAGDSPLHGSPFRVQTEAEDWRPPPDGRPRRAAVSAFGFGGINAHLLIEQYNGQLHPHRPAASAPAPGRPQSSSQAVDGAAKPPQTAVPVAVVGMETLFGNLSGLKDFQTAVFRGNSNFVPFSAHRLKASAELLAEKDVPLAQVGGLIEALNIAVDEFHIPPNEIPDILPQHLLMLKVAAGAMRDAGLVNRVERPAMGAVIGLDFDFEANNYHFRWFLDMLLEQWQAAGRLAADAATTADWIQKTKDAWCPPLTAPRVLGALPSIVASRIAREFKLGGTSFVVSSEETSGLRALDIGVRSLQRGETDAMLVGAVDIVGDIRRMMTFACQHRMSPTGSIRAFDKQADGTAWGEGAAALVIKRLDDALADNDRIYATIDGIGCAGGTGIGRDPAGAASVSAALERCLAEAAALPGDVSHIETHGSGDPIQDRIEAGALQSVFGQIARPVSVGTVKPIIGHTGAASGLASVVKCALGLYQEILPPTINMTRPADPNWDDRRFHFPALAQYWYRNRCEGPRRAVVNAMTADGNFMAVLLKGFDAEPAGAGHPLAAGERRRPLGDPPYALFVVSGIDPSSLLGNLNRLSGFARDSQGQKPGIAETARNWYRRQHPDPDAPTGLAILCGPENKLEEAIEQAARAVNSGQSSHFGSRGGVAYTPHPLGRKSRVAFVYPGSGNHYLGMGRQAAVHWPEVPRGMDADTPRLLSQSLPDVLIPRRVAWQSGWRQDAYQRLISDPVQPIFAQVMHGGLMTGIVRLFGIRPEAVIGYSLGESSGYFALGVWPERESMLTRMQQTDLFSEQLAGPCRSARKAWGLGPEDDFQWTVAVVNRPANEARAAIEDLPYARLLLINTPEECVLGGRKDQVQKAVERLNRQAIYLDGVVTVHCDAAGPVADAYRRLHLFETHPPANVRFYSCARGKAYRITDEAAADSILKQALEGFDFTRTIERAYADGLRVFLELGPGSSCTRMIGRILKDRPHLALSACHRGEDDVLTVLKCLGNLIAHGVPVNLDALYGQEEQAAPVSRVDAPDSRKTIQVAVGRRMSIPELPEKEGEKPASRSGMPAAEQSIQNSGYRIQDTASGLQDPKSRIQDHDDRPSIQADNSENDANAGDTAEETADHPFADLFENLQKSVRDTAEAHQKFLSFSDDMAKSYARTFDMQARLLEQLIENGQSGILPENGIPDEESDAGWPLKDGGEQNAALPAYAKEQCMAFATGKVADVLGPEFAPVDNYPVRVRLPDEPLMLVDRILSVDGQKRSLSSGRIVTEHDVLEGAWYLDADRAPVCISVEAGQADLFLCAYLGIDLAVRGQRSYRLLDASVQFHRGLPRPGETIRYVIDIDKFIQHGQTYMFFFHFEGCIGDEKLITMTDGCAGFFTEAEIENSGGIITTEEERRELAGKRPADWQQLVPLSTEAYAAEQLEALRGGSAGDCFGGRFKNIRLPESLRLPGGRMKLIDRVTELDPYGGRFGLGMIRAEADIGPDDWFLTCHFVDDMTMPGTLMYECCAHTLRVLLQRMGWISENPQVCYEPLVGTKAVLKCRGPVTPSTRQVIYEVELKEIGYNPEPYALADAHMYADGRYIVRFTDMSLKMTGSSRQDIEAFWQARQSALPAGTPATVLYDRDQILAFAVGDPSEAFGERYRPFDRERFIARLPGPPYAFMDRITRTEPPPWVLQPDGWIHSEYDVPENAWYFKADRSGAMPYCVLLEIALQPCGWLAAYAGSALNSEKDLHFRNLDGHADLRSEVFPTAGTLQVRCRITKVSTAGDMIIEGFDFDVRCSGETLFEGNTVFGFFTEAALSRQKGLPQAPRDIYRLTEAEKARSRSFDLPVTAPVEPYDTHLDRPSGLALPSRALLMIDRIDACVVDGGPHGLGVIQGTKTIDPAEWFFKAHFYQDPVCPGSLGVESFLQLLKVYAIERWPGLVKTHRFAPVLDTPHQYQYRGQILQHNKNVEVQAVITAVEEKPHPVVMADGFLTVDGLTIYRMNNFGLRLLPNNLLPKK